MKNRLIILNYHQVPERLDALRPHSIDRTIFRQQLHTLGRYFNVVSLPQGIDEMQQGRLAARSVAITFDDGYRDNYDVAFEELRTANMSATFFIATDYLDGGRMWNDSIVESIRLTPKRSLDLTEFGLGVVSVDSIEQRSLAIRQLIPYFKYLDDQARTEAVARFAQLTEAHLPDDLMMSSEQVKELHRAGMTIGGHTASHPILRSLSVEQCRDDIKKGKDQLTNLLESELRFFAYPNGKPDQDYDRRHVKLLSELGFDAAFTTQWGYVDQSMNRFELSRVGFANNVGWRLGLKALKSFFEAPTQFASEN